MYKKFVYAFAHATAVKVPLRVQNYDHIGPMKSKLTGREF